MKQLPHSSFILILIALVLLLYSSTRGLTYHDEGYILNSASRIIHGDIMYRDFHFAYMPLSAYITSFFFLIGGTSIILERFAAVTISLISIFCVYIIGQKILKNEWMRALVILGFVVWGPVHINFVWPVMIAIAMTLAMIASMCKAKEKNSGWWIMAAGFFMILSLLSKQNFGVASFIILVSSLALLKPTSRKTTILYLLPGIFLPVLLFLVYLLYTQSYIPFIQDFQSYTVQRILVTNSLTTPFIYPSSIPVMVVKTCIYLLPLIIGSALILRAKINRYHVCVGICTIVFYLFGIRPTTDYIHLVPLLALSMVPLGVIAEIEMKHIGFIMMVIVISIGFLRGFYSHYYKWEPPLSKQQFLVSSSEGGVFTSSKVYAEVEGIIDYVRSSKIDTMFVYEYAPLFYFVSGVHNPTAYDLVDNSSFYKPYQSEIITDIEKVRTNTIITGYSVLEDNTEISMYIKQCYSINKLLYDHIIWTK